MAVQLHNTGRSGGKVLHEHLTTILHLEGRKIQRLDTFISDVAMLNAYFVQESIDGSRRGLPWQEKL